MSSDASTWRSFELGSLCSLRGGIAFKRDFQGRTDGPVPFIKVSDMSGPRNAHFIRDAANWVTVEDAAALKGRSFPADTVVFAKIGEALKANRFRILTMPTLIDNNMMGAIPNDDAVDRRFLFFLLQSARLPDQAAGTALPYLRASDLTRLRFSVPPMDEQRRIAFVLGALDDKIDSNRRLAKLLEDAVATLFRARFVDFVGVEEFEENEIGRIPCGWDVRRISEILDTVGGGTPSTKEPAYWDGGTHCWATPRDLSGHTSPVLLDTSRHVTDAGAARISSGVLPPETVLLSSRAPIGYTVMTKVSMAINQGFIAIRPSDRLPNEYVLFWIRRNLETIKNHAGGTTFAEISKRGFRPIPILIPPEEALTEFAHVARAALGLIAGMDRERTRLAAARDALLPKLIIGEIRVPDTSDLGEVIEPIAEEIAGAAP